MEYHLANIMITFHMPAYLAEILKRLLENKFITDEQVHETYLRSPVRMTMYRLRLALKPYNLEVYNERAVGYWMTKNDKEYAAQLLNAADVSVLKTPFIPEDVPERSMSSEASDV